MPNMIIDVREPNEYAQGHVINSLNIPLGEFYDKTARVTNLPTTEEIILYCNSGNRSDQAQQILQKIGYTNSTNGISQNFVEHNFLI